MEKKLPVYKMLISEEDNTEVNYVALVDEPAIDRLWLKFKDEKKFTFKADKQRGILTGALMVADLPIYRRDEKMGEYYVVFDKDNIEKAAMKFAKNGYSKNINFMHQENLTVDGAYLFESFLIDSERGIMPPKGFEGLTDGSWVGSVKIDNKEFWDKFIATDEVMGFSVEGMFGYELEMTEDEKTLNEIIKNINS